MTERPTHTQIPKFVKRALSALILWHLTVIVLIPNPASYFTERYKGWMLPYANLIAMNSVWQFFSPDPGPAVFLRYELRDEDGEGSGKLLFPKVDPSYLERINYIRLVTALRYFAKNESALKEIFAQHLCKTHPKSTSIELELYLVRVPSLEEVAQGRSLNAFAEEMKQFQDIVFCEGKDGDAS